MGYTPESPSLHRKLLKRKLKLEAENPAAMRSIERRRLGVMGASLGGATGAAIGSGVGGGRGAAIGLGAGLLGGGALGYILGGRHGEAASQEARHQLSNIGETMRRQRSDLSYLRGKLSPNK